MLHEKDIQEIVDELNIHAGLYKEMAYDESARMSGLAVGFRDAIDIACSMLVCQHCVHYERQWKVLKNQLLAIGSITWADSEKEPPGYFDGFCQGREKGARLAFSLTKMRNGGEWKGEDDV